MGNKRDLFLKKIASGQSFGLRFDLIDERNRQIFHFGIAENLLPFLRAAGIEFFELGNINATDGTSFKRTSLFAKEIQLISDEILKKTGFKNTQISPRANFIDAAIRHCMDHKNRELLSDFVDFEQKNSHWLQNHALFSALSKYIGTKEFSSWPEGIRSSDRKLRGVISRQLFDRVIFEKTTQFLTHLSLKNFIERARQFGIFIGGTVGILCEEFSSDVWGNQRLFFVDKRSKATVYSGLPPSQWLEHGLKSTKVPFRWNAMYNDKYELMHNLLDKQEADFDYAHVLDGHTVFHCWEVPSFESDGEHGRWVPTKSDLLFEYIKPQLNRFPYIFDFNNPLLPKHELLARRHNLLQAVICGEPEVHSCEQYDLSADIKILASKLCNTKFPLEDGAVQKNLLEAKPNLAGMVAKNFPLKLFHIGEICSALGASVIDIANKPEHYGEVLRKILAGNAPSAG
ncbi:MAG: 4-alpha-glucanotransferase, partial [Puniceicoccales bacterium]|nr:4-alpha-glucanotransferase [Puniceicoccales bacterium]